MYVPDLLVEEAIGGWIGDHDGCELLSILIDEVREVLHVDAALLVNLHRTYLHTCHLSARKVRAVS